MHFSAKCNSGRIAIQWFHIKYYLDYQYTKFQPYTFRVQKMCVFARYATLVPRLLPIEHTFNREGSLYLAVCRALRGLPVGFLLLRYSVLFTVESLSLLYLLFIS